MTLPDRENRFPFPCLVSFHTFDLIVGWSGSSRSICLLFALLRYSSPPEDSRELDTTQREQAKTSTTSFAPSKFLDCSPRFTEMNRATGRTNQDNVRIRRVKTFLKIDDYVRRLTLWRKNSSILLLRVMPVDKWSVKTEKFFFRPPLSDSKRIRDTSEKAFSAACVIASCIRFVYNRSVLSLAIYYIVAQSFVELKWEYVVAPYSSLFEQRVSSLVAKANWNVSARPHSCIPVQFLLHPQ